MISKTLNQDAKIYKAICDSIDRRTEREIDALFAANTDEENKTINVGPIPENVDRILKGAEWDKERFAQLILFGTMFNDIPEERSYEDYFNNGD